MMERIRRMREQEGFTLIELLIVIVILGVLAGVVVFAVNGINNRGNQAACQSDVKTVTVGLEAYFAKNGNYPATLAALTTDPNKFLQAIPAAPGTVLTYTPSGGPPATSYTLTGVNSSATC